MPEDAVSVQLNTFQDESLQVMVDAGVFYGRQKSKTNPRMKPFIFGNRNGIEIIDLTKTSVGLARASEFIKEEVSKRRELFLCVGTQPAGHDMKEMLAEFNFPIVMRRWIGGTLTNYKTIALRIERLVKLRTDRDKGLRDQYTKKEQVMLDREIARLEQLVGSLENMTRLPDALIVIDSHLHATAVREANRLKIPVIAFDNTDANPDHVDYLVVGNNTSRKSVAWFLNEVREAIREGKRMQAVIAEQAVAEKKEI